MIQPSASNFIMPLPSPHTIDTIRANSRQLVRELGFMGGTFAGTDLSPSAVHALIEIEAESMTARDLGARLHLEKSSVSRMLRKLVVSGDIKEGVGEEDARLKKLSLTKSGKKRVAKIHAYARAQVSDAFARLQPGEDRIVLDGLRLYTDALATESGNRAALPAVEIVSGYQSGIIARITEMHAVFYARTSGFGQRFESVVAGGLAEFCNRLENPKNAIWTALQSGSIVGSIAIDGEDMGEGAAHLRWFIVDDNVRGSGAGRKLLSAALAFVDSQSFSVTRLWTFSGLSVARHLYEANGFALVEERTGDQWGKEVMEQRFLRPFPKPKVTS
jgi:DNA-binding MarR family transcriptional regulator/N-acetylglutamate synthase-like GNAT family acetyltransferase